MRLRNVAPRRALVWTGGCVLVALIVIAVIGTLVLARQVDANARARDAERSAQLVAGCERGNLLRAIVREQADGLREANLYIASVLREAVESAAPATPPAVLARTLRQAAHFEALAARVKRPPDQDCRRLYGGAR